MKNIPPALENNSEFKNMLFAQKEIVSMIKSRNFKTARQFIPHNPMNETVVKLEIDKGKKKVFFPELLKAIFYSILMYNDTTSRRIASVGNDPLGKIFCRMPSVSHTAVLDNLNGYDEKKIDAIMSQITAGVRKATERHSQATDKVRIVDATTFTLPYSRTKDKLPKSGSTSDDEATKGQMKLGVVMSPSNFAVLDWKFTTDYDDNQVFRDLIDWDKTGYTWVIDRGNVEVGYLKRFTLTGMHFIQKSYDGHTFIEESSKELPKTSLVCGRYRPLKEKLGRIVRQKDGMEVKVRRIIVKDKKDGEIISLTTNDLTSPNYVIVKRFDKRWDIEVLNDWLKNTIGPNDHHAYTQWTRLTALRNLIRIWLVLITLLCSFAYKCRGPNWWEPQNFSLMDVIREYRNRLRKWLEAKLEYRARHSRSKGVG